MGWIKIIQGLGKAGAGKAINVVKSLKPKSSISREAAKITKKAVKKTTPKKSIVKRLPSKKTITKYGKRTGLGLLGGLVGLEAYKTIRGPKEAPYTPYTGPMFGDSSPDRDEQIRIAEQALEDIIRSGGGTEYTPLPPYNSGTGAGTGASTGAGMGSNNFGDDSSTYVNDYDNLRKAFGAYAGNLRGFGSAKGAGIRGTYDALSQESLADAAKAEAIARASYEDIGRIGKDYSAQATADISSVGAGGPNELTGMTPVTGDSYDIPGSISDNAQIAADYTLRDLNLTRDDLQYMSSMAKQMGPAYEAELNDNIAMLIANKQFELEQNISSQQIADRREQRAYNEQRRMMQLEFEQQKYLAQQEAIRQASQSNIDYQRDYVRDQNRYGQERSIIEREIQAAAARDKAERDIALLLEKTNRVLTPEDYQGYAESYAAMLKTESGKNALLGAGINSLEEYIANKVASGQ